MTTDARHVTIQRAYEAPAPDDGHYRVLVDRLWPRGLAKQDLVIDEWNKDLAPSPALRKWFGHKLENWERFQATYRAELREGEQQQRMKDLIERAGAKPITFIYGAKDTEHNHAVVLAAEVERLY
jgi:uncharacterized protein YeaO (DUF488 family)